LSTEQTQRPYDLEEIAQTIDTDPLAIEAYEKEGSVQVDIKYGRSPDYEALDTVKTQLSAYLQSTSSKPEIEGNITGDLGQNRFRVADEDLRTVERGVANFLRDLEDSEVEK